MVEKCNIGIFKVFIFACLQTNNTSESPASPLLLAHKTSYFANTHS